MASRLRGIEFYLTSSWVVCQLPDQSVRWALQCLLHSCEEVSKQSIFKSYLEPEFLYPRDTKYVGVYSFRFSVRPSVRTFVRSSFRHRVKVFAIKVIRPHILKTLWWISFIPGMMVDIGRKCLSASSPSRGWPLGQGHGLRIFIKKVKSFCV